MFRRILRFAFLSCLALLASCRTDPREQRDKFLQSAREYAKSGKHQEAVLQYRNALRIDQNYAPTYLELAESLQNQGDLRNAIATWRRLLEIDSKNVKAKLALGPFLLLAGIQDKDQFKTVKQFAEDVLAAEPANIQARFLLGQASAGLNDLERASSEMEKVLVADPTHLQAGLSLGAIRMRQNNNPLAEAAFQSVLQKHPESPEAHIAIAMFYGNTGRLAETENFLKKAFDLKPEEGPSLYGLVNFYLSQKKEKEAEAVFRQAMTRKPEAREPRWGLANFYLQRGKVDEGLAILEELSKTSPKDRQAKLRLAEVQLDRKHGEATEKIVQAMLAENKNDPEARYLQGRLLGMRGESEKALQEFNAALKLNENLAGAYLQKAVLLLNRGELAEAQTALKAAMERDRTNLAARGLWARTLALQQKPAEALAEAQAVLSVLPQDENALAAKAEALAGQGKAKEGLDTWKNLTAQQPQNAYYWHRFGLAEVASGATAAAMEHFKKAVSIKPDFLPAINDILYLYFKDKKYDAALAELDRIGGRSPQDEVAIFRGKIQSSRNNYGEAEKEFRRAIEINPQNYQAYILLGQLNLQQKKFPEAVAEVDKLIAKNEKFTAAYLLKGFYLQSARNNTGAIENYRKALNMEPDNVVAGNNLAWLLADTGKAADLDEALKIAGEIKKLAPENAEVADTLGWIYYKKKYYAPAVDQLLFSVNHRQGKAEHYYRLGLAYNAKGDLMLAQQTLRKALEMDPRYPDAQEAKRILTLRR